MEFKMPLHQAMLENIDHVIVHYDKHKLFGAMGFPKKLTLLAAMYDLWTFSLSLWST